MNTGHYSAGRARRSLLQFAIGKGLSATVGLVVLLLSVRMMATAEFGLYVAAIAFIEIFYLATGFGLSTIAQRYVAEFRLKSDRDQFAGFLMRIVLRRLLYAIVGAALVGVFSTLWVSTGRATPPVVQVPVFYVLLILGCITRYADEIFPALLLQGYTQGLLITTHLLRLGGLIGCMSLNIAVGISEMLLIEVFAGLVCSVASLVLLRRYLAADCTPSEDLSSYSNPLMNGVAGRFYVVQLLGQLWGPNTGKLIVAERLGLVATATYGFVQSITDMLRNYLPAYLLSSWVRPLMISRYLVRGDLQEVNAMASLMLKLSLMCIAPAAAFFLAGGDIFVGWASGGKVTEGAILLAVFCGLLALQCTHVVISMITVTVERANASVIATIAACSAFPLCIVGAFFLGPVGVIAGMAVGECVWVATALTLLRREGLHIKLDPSGSLMVTLSTLPAYAAVKLLLSVGPPLPPLCFTILGVALSGLLVLAINALWKPFKPAEREFIVRLVPERFFIW
jgi:O-antigen/teichoic acid export membrane protein